MTAEVVLVNGAPDRGVSAFDRGLHFGDGLFETIACLQGRPRFLSLHLERLARGAARLNLQPLEVGAVRTEISDLAVGVERAIVKVMVTRGSATGRGYAAAGNESATRITIRYGWPPEDAALSHDGVMVRTVNLRLGENPLLAGLKHCNRLEQILARSEWSDTRIAEGIVFSSSGKLVSGTMSNVFLVSGDCLTTPRIDSCGVEGVMRRVVLREAERLGIPTRECVLGEEDVRGAGEVFLTNARIGIWPVRALDGRTLSPGAVTRRLQACLAPLLETPADA